MGGRSLRCGLVAAALLVAFTACSSSSSGGIKGTESDFKITLDKTSASAGKVTFNVTNNGPSTHEFVIFKTNLPQDQLPTKKENGAVVVNETGPGVQHIDEIPGINKGDTKSLTVNLKPGKYVIICNLPTHYQLGMHVPFTVK